MTEILDGNKNNAKGSKTNGLLAPPVRSTANVTVSDISLNVQENGNDLTPSKVHCDIKSGVSEELKKRILAIKPNDLANADKLWVTNVNEAVKLRIGQSGHSAQTPITLHSMVTNIVEKAPDAIAIGYKKHDVWVELSYMEYFESILKTAKSFLKLGLEAGAGVGIIGFNSLEWFLSFMGAVYCSAVGVGVYTTNNPEACEFVLGDSRCNIACVENAAQLNKIMKVKDNLKHLKAIIQWSGEVEVQDPMVYSWGDFQKLGEDVPDDLLVGRVKMMAPNKCCSLIYTSGTTGNPKGVMISHDNVTWTAASVVNLFNLHWLTEVTISYLPLSHIAAQMQDIIISLACGTAVYFAQPDALKGSLGITLREIRPTLFFAVPRVWEKFSEKLQALGATQPGYRKAIGAWAKGIGLKGCFANLQGKSTPWGWKAASLILFNKVRKNLGFDRCRYFFSGAAPLSKETQDYFASLNIPILELYGMSESSGPHTVCHPDHYREGSCGVDIPGVRTVIFEPDDGGNGEICMDGRHVFMGYLNNDEKTRETVDNEGLLHSGDIGKQVKGFLYITGRIKELLITAGGENVAPIPIEDNVKQELPCIGNCMLIGDRRKFLSILLALKTEIDEEGRPQDVLTKQAQNWLKSQGVTATTVTDIRGAEQENFTRAIQNGIDRANTLAVSRATKIQKWSILPRDFSIIGGELGPTMKLRRPIVTKMYEQEIEAFYEGC